MDDWSPIGIQEFDARVTGADVSIVTLVSALVFERLPFAFESKPQYLIWKERLAEGLNLDARDIVLVGSAATGRSLSARKKFGVFHAKSDVDIAVVSPHHFDIAWDWFRRTDPNLLTGLDAEGRKSFDNHRSHYVYDGIIAANIFLSYLPFGNDWSKELQRAEQFLPVGLRGRLMRVRIYRNNHALRISQVEAMATYHRSKSDPPNPGGLSGTGKLP